MYCPHLQSQRVGQTRSKLTPLWVPEGSSLQFIFFHLITVYEASIQNKSYVLELLATLQTETFKVQLWVLSHGCIIMRVQSFLFAGNASLCINAVNPDARYIYMKGDPKITGTDLLRAHAF